MLGFTGGERGEGRAEVEIGRITTFGSRMRNI